MRRHSSLKPIFFQHVRCSFSAMSRQCRRRTATDLRLSDIKELRHVSRPQFLKLARQLRDNPTLLIDATHRVYQQDLYQRFLTAVVTDEYDLHNGEETFTLESLDPGLLVQMACHAAPALAKLYLKAHAAMPCSDTAPWHLILGWDEFVPGRFRAGQQSKKTMCLYFNFRELGPATLTEDCTWMCPLIVGTRMESNVNGGWSRIFGDFLHRCFFGPNGFLTAGVPIVDEGNMMMLYAKLDIAISDGDGLKKAFAWKGAGGIKPCLRCWNVLRKGSGLSEDGLPGYCEISHHEPADFQAHTASSFFRSADTVEAAYRMRRSRPRDMTQDLLDQTCKGHGFTFHPLALPWRYGLRPWRYGIDWYSSFRYDWVHTMLQDGPLAVDMFEYLKICRDDVNLPDVSFKHVQEWLQLPWCFPGVFKSKCRQLHEVFSEWRNQKDKNGNDVTKLHASCSELLGCYGLVRLFLQMRVPDAPERAAAKDSFLLACRLVDICQAAKKRTMSMHDAAGDLEATHIQYMQKHKDCNRRGMCNVPSFEDSAKSENVSHTFTHGTSMNSGEPSAFMCSWFSIVFACVHIGHMLDCCPNVVRLC